MTTKRHVPKFHRATPAVRREALVDATLRPASSNTSGHEGVSVRRISAAAGVSIGLINHHFPSKSGLIAETYETIALDLLDTIRKQAEIKSLTPRERLSNFFRASFTPELLDPQLFSVWVVFLEHEDSAHSAEIRAVHTRHLRQVSGRARVHCSAQLIESGAAAPFKLRPAAIALSALLDGFWSRAAA